jgi:hypothetical protein
MNVNQHPSTTKADRSASSKLVIEAFNEFDVNCAGVCICTAVYVIGEPSATAIS